MRLFTTDSDSWGAMYKQASGSPFRLVLLLALCVAAAPGFPGDVVPIEPDRGHRKPDTRKTAAERKAEQRAAIRKALLKHAEGAARKWSFDCARELNAVQPAYFDVLKRLIDHAKAKTGMRADPEFEAFVLAFVDAELKDGTLARGSHLKAGVLERVPLLNRDLGVAVWARYLRHAFSQDDGAVIVKKLYTPPSSAFRMAAGEDPAVFRRRVEDNTRQTREAHLRAREVALQPARAQLRGALKKQLEAAAGRPAKERVKLMFQYAFTGGTVTWEEIEALLARVEADGTFSYLDQQAWGEVIARTGNPLGLRILLALGPNTRDHAARFAIAQFEYLAGKSGSKYGDRQLFLTKAGALKNRARRNRDWLAANHANLAWDDEGGRFRLKGADRFAGEPETPPGTKKPTKPVDPDVPPPDDEF